MGEGTCNIDIGTRSVAAFSVTDCESMNEEKCKAQNGGGCYWDEENGKCLFGNLGIAYENLRDLLDPQEDPVTLLGLLKNNAAIGVSVGVFVVVLLCGCVVGALLGKL